jgi:sporulation protein YhbH
MAIIDHDDWDLSGKGRKDAARHREKVEDTIKKNIRDVIGEESIITNKHGKTVRVPIKGLKDYRFVYGSGGGQAGGVGQGPAKPGDTIGRRNKKGSKSPGAGNQRGEDYMETEVDIDYLINIMFQDLGLPYIEEKSKAEQLVPSGWKFETISKIGIQPRMHKHRTIKETMKRTATFVGEIIEETGCEDEIAYRALVMSKGELNEAIQIVKEDRVDMDIDPNTIFIEDDDLRFKQMEQDYEIHSNAVVIAMMDTSGSMTPQKKYLARSMLFWMVEFLKKSYTNVRIRFITHTTDAQIVDEETFFKRGESGGTACHTAFDLADNLIEIEYPTDQWNVYVVYISDGEDFYPDKTMDSTQKILKRKISMLGYCEIDIERMPYGRGQNLMEQYKKRFKFKVSTENGTNFYKDDENHFLACMIKGKEHIYPALKHMLFQKQEKK